MQNGRRTEKLLLEGPGARVVAIVDEGEECQVTDFLEALSERRPSAFAKIQALIGMVAEIGPEKIRNKEKVKSLGDGLYELKAHQVRIFWCYGPSSGGQRRVVLLYGLIKKKDRHSSKDMKRARELKRAYEQGMAR